MLNIVSSVGRYVAPSPAPVEPAFDQGLTKVTWVVTDVPSLEYVIGTLSPAFFVKVRTVSWSTLVAGWPFTSVVTSPD